MFDALADKFGKLQRRLRGFGSLTEKEIKDALREIRVLLLEADVNYKVVGAFIRGLRAELEERDVFKSLKPGEVVNAALYEELVKLLGGKTARLTLGADPSLVCLVGLQGTGKTTFAGKLARQFKSRRPLLVACDPKRPAASEQLRLVAEQAGAGFVPAQDDVVANCVKAVKLAKEKSHGVVVFDTAGRLHIDADMMGELKTIQDKTRPHATLLVLDGMVGQDAVNQAVQFSELLDITGVCITKLDGDTRGGAVVSVRQSSGLPVYFVGTGEKLADLEEFHPDRMAARILGRGDLKTLAEKVQSATSLEEQQATAAKFMKGKFDFEDFLDQLRSIRKMGSFSKLLEMVPGASGMNVDEGELVKVEAMIQSMTPRERHNPDIIDGSRRRRIADGSGTSATDINRLLKEFRQARSMAKQMGGAAGGKLPTRLQARPPKTKRRRGR